MLVVMVLVVVTRCSPYNDRPVTTVRILCVGGVSKVVMLLLLVVVVVVVTTLLTMQRVARDHDRLWTCLLYTSPSPRDTA